MINQNKIIQKVEIFYNDKDDSITIIYNSDGQSNLDFIMPQNIVEYFENIDSKSVTNFVEVLPKQEQTREKIYKFKKKVVIVCGGNAKSEFTRECKIDIYFYMIDMFLSVFEKGLELKFCNFFKDIVFANCVFNGDIMIFHCDFQQKIDFNSSIIKKEFICISANFCNKTSFHNTQFENIPIFASSCFENPQMVDFVRVKIKNGIETLRIPQWQKANILEVRDSYRAIKNILIIQNNLLDASYWHKLELYTKEIELKNEKPKPFSKEWIDLWQLKLYRLTSNHHTDLLRIFSLLVILIGCFATTLFFVEYYGNPKIWYGIFWATLGAISIFTAFGKIRYLGFFTLLSLVPCAWLVSYNPKYIFGVASLFGDNNCNGVFLNFAFSIYTILFILLIFSLQKTARRNSIIPT